MSFAQLSLLEPQAPRARLRHVRRPFTPSEGAGPYRLPRDIRDWLLMALASFRNRDTAFQLATFLGRFWSTPTRITSAFPIDRRALMDRSDLGLTGAKVRGAIKTLEAVSFLDRALAAKGSCYQRAGGGELHRKPIMFMFGSAYATAFAAANKRSQKAKGRRFRDPRGFSAEGARQPSRSLSVPSLAKS